MLVPLFTRNAIFFSMCLTKPRFVKTRHQPGVTIKNLTKQTIATIMILIFTKCLILMIFGQTNFNVVNRAPHY